MSKFRFFHVVFLIYIGTLGRANAEAKIVAFGDSITTGFNSSGALDRKANSWSTGHRKSIDFLSHFKRIKSKNPTTKAYNFAVAGSQSFDLENQINRMIKRSVKPEYVTILTGANDLCGLPLDGSLIKDYRSNIDKAVSKIVKYVPEVKVLLVGIPDMRHLYAIGSNDRSCRFRWKILNLCQKLLGEGTSPEKRDEFQSYWYRLNQQLESVASAWGNETVRFAREVSNFEFEIHHISRLDCFHPSLAGQNLISRVTWPAIWFPASATASK